MENKKSRENRFAAYSAIVEDIKKGELKNVTYYKSTFHVDIPGEIFRKFISYYQHNHKFWRFVTFNDAVREHKQMLDNARLEQQNNANNTAEIPHEEDDTISLECILPKSRVYCLVEALTFLAGLAQEMAEVMEGELED